MNEYQSCYFATAHLKLKLSQLKSKLLSCSRVVPPEKLEFVCEMYLALISNCHNLFVVGLWSYTR